MDATSVRATCLSAFSTLDRYFLMRGLMPNLVLHFLHSSYVQPCTMENLTTPFLYKTIETVYTAVIKSVFYFPLRFLVAYRKPEFLSSAKKRLWSDITHYGKGLRGRWLFVRDVSTACDPDRISEWPSAQDSRRHKVLCTDGSHWHRKGRRHSLHLVIGIDRTVGIACI
jgi:hypothetical protein